MSHTPNPLDHHRHATPNPEHERTEYTHIRQRAVTYCCQDELLRGHEDTVGGGEPCLDGKTGLMMGFLSSDKINIYLRYQMIMLGRVVEGETSEMFWVVSRRGKKRSESTGVQNRGKQTARRREWSGCDCLGEDVN